MRDAAFEVGQKVTVYDHYSGPLSITTVAKVGKLKMTLADGSEWRADGWKRWGASDRFYTGSHVRKHTPDDDEKFFRNRAVQQLCAVKWGTVSTDTLRLVLKALTEARSREAPAEGGTPT